MTRPVPKDFPPIGDHKAWAKVHRNQWLEIADDSSRPDWLRSLAAGNAKDWDAATPRCNADCERCDNEDCRDLVNELSGGAKVMTFLELLRSGQEFDCELIIGDVDMPASFVWSEGCIITDYGIETFRAIMDAEAKILENGNIEVLCDDWRMGEFFAFAAAGYIGIVESEKIFGD